MNSVKDFEQLRLSFAEQDYKTGIYQVHQWLEVNGSAMLRANQRLPYDLNEANELRKQHEKMELKCMKFLAYFVQMSLKGIPQEYEELRQDMDIGIQRFSEKIKCRRNVVVTYVTFYRHYEELLNKLKDMEEIDLENMPETVEGINSLVKSCHRNVESITRRFGHLKEEKERISFALQMMLEWEKDEAAEMEDDEEGRGSRNNQTHLIDLANITNSEAHLESLLNQIQTQVTHSYENNKLLELELKTESKILQIEEDVGKCCDWLMKIETLVKTKYNSEVIGRGTLENNELYRQNEELAERYEETYKYGTQLVKMYDDINERLNRNNNTNDIQKPLLTTYKRGQQVLEECRERLGTAHSVYLSLDETLNEVEDVLLNLGRDIEKSEPIEVIRAKFEPNRERIHDKFDKIKQLASQVCRKLHYNLHEEPQPEQCNHEIDATDAAIKMKIFTLAVKIQELDNRMEYSDAQVAKVKSYMSTDSIRSRSSSNVSNNIVPSIVRQTRKAPPTSFEWSDSLENDIDKYKIFLDASRRNWQSKVFPKTIDQSRKNLNDHKKLKPESDEYWKHLQQHITNEISNNDDNSSRSSNIKPVRAQLANCAQYKDDWEQDWGRHLHQELVPRHGFLERLYAVNGQLDKELSDLDDISRQPIDQLDSVESLIGQLVAMESTKPNQKEELNELMAESKHLYNGDFNNSVAAVDEKYLFLQNQLKYALELENMIGEIHEYTPDVDQFRNNWIKRSENHKIDSNQINRLNHELMTKQDEINDKFDMYRLRELAKHVYGNSNKVDWLIDRLKLPNPIYNVNQSNNQPITPRKSQRQMTSLSPQHEPMESKQYEVLDAEPNSRVEMVFDIEQSESANLSNLPRVDCDQYNLLWYKNDSIIKPNSSNDSRIVSWNEVDNTGKVGLIIDECKESDAGVYQCEVPEIDAKSQLVKLAVRGSPQVPGYGTQIPDIIYAPLKEPVLMKLKLDPHYSTPSKGSSTKSRLPTVQLLHNDEPVEMTPKTRSTIRNMSSGEFPWQQSVDNNGILELHKPQITKNDSGHYKLLVDNQIVAQTEITVGEPPRFLQHNFTKRVHLHENVSVVVPIDEAMSCHHANKESHKISHVEWTKDGYELSQLDHPQQYQQYTDAKMNPVLMITRFSNRNTGSYKCVVANVFGQREAQINLMLCERQDEHSKSQCDEGAIHKRNASPKSNTLPPLPPTYSRKSRGSIDALAVKSGDKLTLTFPYNSTRSPKVQWNKDGQNINGHLSDDKYKISYPTNECCLLEVFNTTSTDSGIYTAVEENSKDRKTTRVEVMPGGCRPIIDDYPQRVTAKANQTAQLACVVRSIPFADQIDWTFQPATSKNAPIKSISSPSNHDSRLEFSNQPITDSYGEKQLVKLTIHKPTQQDSGEYFVKCTNKIGSNSAKISLVVNGHAEHKATPPRFTLPLQSDIVGSINNPVLLKCKINGNPAPVVHWTKDDQILSNGNNIRIDQHGEKHELTIFRLTPKKVGNYRVVATNTHGDDTNNCQVKLSRYEFSSDDNNQLVPTIVGSQMKGLNYGNSNNKLSDSGSDLESLSGDDNEGTKQQRRTQLVFSNTVVRCPPQFVATFTDELVQEGDDLVLKCCLIGQPEPVVWWSYNTHFLKDNPRFHMSRERDEYCLIMRDLIESDSGRYSITAENSSGLATCSALVIVEKSMQRSRSVDRTKYPTKSKPLEGGTFPCHTTLSHIMNPRISDESRLMQASPYGWSHNNNGGRNDDDAADLPKSAPSTLKIEPSRYKPDMSPLRIIDDPQNPDAIDVDVKSIKTKTIKTYHYSGPSGVDLPGVGFISRAETSKSPVPLSETTSSINSTISSGSSTPVMNEPSNNNSTSRYRHTSSTPVRARFVPGNSTSSSLNRLADEAEGKTNPVPQSVPVVRVYDNSRDENRFSMVESSDCDTPL